MDSGEVISRQTFLDVRIFNPHTPTNKNTTISNCYRKHEAEKKWAYEQHILKVEQSTFTPLIFSATGGMTKQSTTFYRRLASLLADKWEHPYSSTLYWLRCLLSFSLLRSAIQCIRSACSSHGHASRSPHPIDPPNPAEAHIIRTLTLITFFYCICMHIYIFSLFLFTSKHSVVPLYHNIVMFFS